ncbi:hypothetical protein CHARACLAT_031263 [Characodon lateralis]|uniref:Uncharacterized protein n=1 Tax=Characodon lateralis TaxID=208331 RepID=A0ABU7EYB2_9TELE|nr:hypothetical protein [Characodon lateralis]
MQILFNPYSTESTTTKYLMFKLITFIVFLQIELWNRRHCAVMLWGTYVSCSRSAPSLKATDENKLYSGVRAVSCIMLKSSSKQSGLHGDKPLPDAKDST